MFDIEDFNFESTDECERFQIAVNETVGDQDNHLVATEQIHSKLCDALTKPLKMSQKFLQSLSELIVSLSIPADVVLRKKAFHLSMDQDGSRLVQAALQAGDRKVQLGIIADLQGHVCEMMSSPHANHVLQRIIELLPPGAVKFIFQEMSYKWGPDFVAKHKFGCRVLERMIEHFPVAQEFPAWTQFLDRLLENAAVHCYHSFATFIMQHLMEHGTEEHKRVIAAAVTQELERAASDSHASGVLDKALCFLPVQEQLNLASEILKIDGLLGRMIGANRPAAERLLRIVSGPMMIEARRQLSVAFPDTTTRTKALKSVFGSGRIPCDEDATQGLEAIPQTGVSVLLAPKPMSMGEGRTESFSTLSVPSQIYMTDMASTSDMVDLENAWWNATVNQVFALWSNDQSVHQSWSSDPMNQHWG